MLNETFSVNFQTLWSHALSLHQLPLSSWFKRKTLAFQFLSFLLHCMRKYEFLVTVATVTRQALYQMSQQVLDQNSDISNWDENCCHGLMIAANDNPPTYILLENLKFCPKNQFSEKMTKLWIWIFLPKINDLLRFLYIDFLLDFEFSRLK